MNHRRRNQIVELALEFLVNHTDTEDLVRCWENQSDEEFSDEFHQKLPELYIPSPICSVILCPLYKELVSIMKPGKKGNSRTKEIVTLALLHLQGHLEDIPDLFPYMGDAIRFEDTHISLGDQNFRTPTEEEIEELLGYENLILIVKNLPPIKTSILWNVYDRNEEDGRYEWIDGIFGSGCDTPQSIKRSLVDHDGYNPGIILSPQIMEH